MPFKKTHGLSRGADGKHTRLYGRWANIKDRCHNKSSKDFPRYGARGIIVCEAWRNDFLAFEKWAIENGYKDGLQLDRIDNDKGYSPENCRWVTGKVNSNNRRNSVRVDFKGEKMRVLDVSKITGIPHPMLYKIAARGESIDEYVRLREKYGPRLWWSKSKKKRGNV